MTFFFTVVYNFLIEKHNLKVCDEIYFKTFLGFLVLKYY